MAATLQALIAPRFPARPLLKWVGGKTQLLPELFRQMPSRFGRYIEPFIGGGALFFALQHHDSVIADQNLELISLYRAVAENVDDVIHHLSFFKNTEEDFYACRSVDWTKLPQAAAAARTIFLNKTCFNGLYRVNKQGHFNVPFGRYKRPTIIDAANLYATSEVLKNTTIVHGDYKEVLATHARGGDLVFLDPPYLPISDYADFKRYTKEQFYEEDHHALAKEVHRLHELGCFVLLTNSNHPLVHEQYSFFSLEVIKTKRSISCRADSRIGEDVLVKVQPAVQTRLSIVPASLSRQVDAFPPTRFMGSKSKLITQIWDVAKQFQYDTAVDLFSGSGIVGYMFKAQGKRVISNDYMAMSAKLTSALIENNTHTLSSLEVAALLTPNDRGDRFVSKNFQGIYYSDDDNDQIDSIRANIDSLDTPVKRDFAAAALIRACFKRRARGIFTYTGSRYDDGRADLRKSISEHFSRAVDAFNEAVFDNGQRNVSRWGDAMTLRLKEPGLVYMDPPYYSPFSDNEYVRRYHFLEGIARNWNGVEIQQNTITKKFKSYPTPFSSRTGASSAFNALFRHYRDNIIMVSYSSNSLPTQDEMVSLLAKYKTKVEVIPVDHRYSFANQAKNVGSNRNSVKELIFVGY